MTGPHYGWGYQQARARLLAGGPLCVHGCGRPATEADHQPPLSRHVHVAGSACCTLVPSCAQHARAQGARLAGVAARLAPVAPPSSSASPAAPVDPFGYPPDDPVWDVDWIAELGDPPADATWPRLMTRPHPAAVGSHGAAVTAHAATYGVDLRWWQRLTVARLFEHDADGRLCWRTAIVSTARQVGKSWALDASCQWRLDAAGDVFDPAQLILHTARKLQVADEIQRRARDRARRDPLERYKVIETNGAQRIERYDDGSRWIVRAKDNVVSLTVDLAVVDEAWDVSAGLIETDVLPTIVARPDAQLLMWSTAHNRATSLVLNRRATLDVTDARRALHVEWSAPPDVADDDRAGWRQASPHWTPEREDMIADRLAAALAGETDDPDEPDPLAAFRSQWLNRWPARRAVAAKGEPLLADGAWAACEGALVDVGAGFVALEDYFGRGAAVAFAAGDGDGRFELDGVACASWDEAVDLARQFVTARPGSRLIVAASMRATVPVDFPNRAAMRLAGQTETQRGLPLLRAVVAAGQVVHDRTVDLDAQLADVRVRPLPSGGLSIVSTARSDVVRAALWALGAAHSPTPPPAVH